MGVDLVARRLTGRLRRSHRRREGLGEAGQAIREHLDSQEVFEATADAVHRFLPSGRTTVWLSRGEGIPVLALSRGHSVRQDDPPPAVLAAARRARPVRHPGGDGAAVPIIGPRAGLLGVLSFEGKAGPEQQAFLEAVAAECGLALETANLYERALAEKEKSEAILARVADAVVVTDGHGTVVEWNTAAEIILGAPASQATGRPCATVLGLEKDGRQLDCSRGCPLLAAGREAVSLLGEEVQRQRPDGSRQPLLASVSAVTDADGAVSEVVHSLRDITRLKEADEAKTLFLATASTSSRPPSPSSRGSRSCSPPPGTRTRGSAGRRSMRWSGERSS